MIKKIFLLLISIVLLASCAQQEINMPDFVGQSYSDVKSEYRKFNFVIEERELTDDYDSGIIYDQNIQPGITVKENRIVLLTHCRCKLIHNSAIASIEIVL